MELPQDSKTRLAIELALVAATFLLLRWLLHGVRYSSQIAELVALILITYLFKRNGKSWKEVGLAFPKRWGMALLYTLLCIATIGLTFNFIIQPLFPHGGNEISGGNSRSFNEMIFQLVFIGIGAAAIGEEMLFRGFLLNQMNSLFGKNALGTALAVGIQAFVFGVLHNGVQGMVSAGVIGIIMGVYYLLSDRNLLVVMIAHAVPDTLSIISSYQSQ